MRLKKLLIIGKIPPPIGGVTIHTSRLLDHLDFEKIEHNFYDNYSFNISTFIYSIWKAKIAHIHLDNPFFLFIFSLLCRILNTYSIITIHGKIFRYRKIFSFFEWLSIRFSNKVILLNDYSFEIAIKINSNSMRMSAFIPPIQTIPLDPDLQKKIQEVKAYTSFVFCTNAYSLAYDKNGKEIYGIFELIDFFLKNNHLALVISDPKGDYYTNFLNKGVKVSDNIKFLLGNHPFVEVVKVSDCVIRNTTTDGDSLSVNEALYFGKKVIATNCVNRPEGVIVYGANIPLKLNDAINLSINSNNDSSIKKPKNAAIELVKLYNNLNA
jgi:glycosyltransferase involved in cell wall biosynthesis